MAHLELYGTRACPHTTELREHLQWRRIPFTEYDVESDSAARERLQQLVGPRAAVPVLVEDGRIRQIGWHGSSCLI